MEERKKERMKESKIEKKTVKTDDHIMNERGFVAKREI